MVTVGGALFVIARSAAAAAPTVVVAVDELLALVPSAARPTVVTVAVFVTVPVADGAVTTIAAVAEAPLASGPNGHRTWLVKEHDPCDGVADTNVSSAGSVSAIRASCVGLGPLFVTVTV